jgi:hypothetical protein
MGERLDKSDYGLDRRTRLAAGCLQKSSARARIGRCARVWFLPRFLLTFLLYVHSRFSLRAPLPKQLLILPCFYTSRGVIHRAFVFPARFARLD